MRTRKNKIRNPDFSSGKRAPLSWTWNATSPCAQSWQRDSATAVDAGGITIISQCAEGVAGWSQTVVCKPGRFYRVEAELTCELTTDGCQEHEAAHGVVVRVTPVSKGCPREPERTSPGLLHASRPVILRAYYKIPKDVRRLLVSVSVVQSRGMARISQVRLFEILDPEEASHPLAIPAPAHASAPPRTARSACVCSLTAETRPLTRFLARCLGQANVHTLSPREPHLGSWRDDALLLPDAEPPAAIHSLSELIKTAQTRMVVIALPALARLAGKAASVRRVEQADDPIRAKVMYANHATWGFALHDVFPYAWSGRAPGSFVQNQFRKTEEFSAFCSRHGFVTLLASVCDRNVTSDRPICLYRETRGGGLFVLDVEPTEEDGSTLAEPALAVHLLLSILGRTQSGLGQYVAAARTEAEFRGVIKEMGAQFKRFVVHGADVPIEEVTEQLVTIGDGEPSFGPSATPQPAILVRSGLTSGDVDSVYGTLPWFKQLVRMEPYVCPYARQLGSHFRLAWIPCAAPWEAADGWQRTSRRRDMLSSACSELVPLAALIDVVSRPVNQIRVVIPKAEGLYQRYVTWLPRLWAGFGPGPHFTLDVTDGKPFHDRDLFEWRYARNRLQVVAAPRTFETDVHREVMAGGGEVIRIECPESGAAFTARSIQRTDVVATVLEHVVGLQYGLIAVNRQQHQVQFEELGMLMPGQTLILDRRDHILQRSEREAPGRFSGVFSGRPPGEADRLSDGCKR